MICLPAISLTIMSWRKISTRFDGAACTICGNRWSRSYSREEERLLRVGDVHDVDVGAFLVVDDHRIRLVAGVPGEDAVDLVRRLLACAGHRLVSHTLGERRRGGRLRHVVDVHAAEAGLVLAHLVVRDEDVAGERGRRDRKRLHALARVAALLGADEGDLLRARRILDVDDVDAVVLAGDDAPRGEIGVSLVDAHVRDLLRDDVLQLQLAHELHVRRRALREQMPLVRAVLVRVAGAVLDDDAAVLEHDYGRRGRDRNGDR